MRSESTVSMSTAMSTVGSQVPSTIATGSASTKGQPPLKNVLTTQWLKSQSQNAPSGETVKTRRSSATEPPRNLESNLMNGVENSSVKTGAYLSTSFASKMSASSAIPAIEERKLNLGNLPRVVPKWRCFIKSVTVTHIMLCFVPASFDDLRLLVQGYGIVQYRQEDGMVKQQDPSHDREDSSPPFINVDGVEFVQKFKKVHVSGNKATVSEFRADCQHDADVVASEPFRNDSQSGCTTNDKEFASNETLEHQDDKPSDERLPDQPDHVPYVDLPKDRDTLADNYKPFVIPVYTYNCPLSSLTDQLVNKLTYKSPADIFQDLTFASEPEDNIQEEGDTKKEVIHIYFLIFG